MSLVTACVLTCAYPVFFWQPMKLGEHLNSLLLNMCDDVTLSRMSLRTVLDICSKHIRNSTCDPPFSYIRKLVRLVLGSLSQVLSLNNDTSTAFLSVLSWLFISMLPPAPKNIIYCFKTYLVYWVKQQIIGVMLTEVV